MGQLRKPAPASGFKPADHDGRLVLIEPQSIEQVPDLNHPGEVKDATKARVVVLDGPNAPIEFPDSLIHPVVLQMQLKPLVGSGDFTIGRLGKGFAKAGQNAPWKLEEDLSAADLAIAEKSGAVSPVGAAATGGTTASTAATDDPWKSAAEDDAPPF